MLDNTFFMCCLTYIFISLVLIELNACVLQHEEGFCSSSISSSNDFNKRFRLFISKKDICYGGMAGWLDSSIGPD